MENGVLRGSQPTFCAQVDKVYDWVINNFPIPSTALDTGLTGPCATDATINSVSCEISSFTFDITNTTDVDFVIDGVTVTLQSVTITKTVSYTITVNYTTAAGVATTETVTVAAPTPIMETVILCAPTGTTIDVTLSPNSTCNILSTDCTTGTLVVTLGGTLCQSIIVTYPAVVELTETFCVPREEILPTCPPPTIPPQCPLVFGPPPAGA